MSVNAVCQGQKTTALIPDERFIRAEEALRIAAEAKTKIKIPLPTSSSSSFDPRITFGERLLQGEEAIRKAEEAMANTRVQPRNIFDILSSFEWVKANSDSAQIQQSQLVEDLFLGFKWSVPAQRPHSADTQDTFFGLKWN